ncbi:MAG: outer membrane lipoprotein carrier protein LolA [Bacteroidia bacterium]|nr:outer membrane lipoprotein carrier protein LolA [Bacteroidia bacterium]
MKQLFSILFTLTITANIFAQDANKAKAILDDLSKTTKTYKSIESSFSFNSEDKNKKAGEKQDGSLIVKGNKYKVEIAGQTIICDGKTIWTYLKESNEVQINNFDEKDSEDKITPSNIFTIYEKGFKYEFEKEETVKGIVYQKIKLFPTDPKKKNYHTAVLTIDKVKKQIASLKVLNKDGGSSTYIVKKFVPNAVINDNLFTFTKSSYPAGIEVIDLRE